jgi:homospermidine synthase
MFVTLIINKMVSQIVFVGFGAVARCLFTLIPEKEPEWLSKPVVIIDPRTDLKEDPVILTSRYTKDVVVINDSIDSESLPILFDKYVSEGGVVFDLSYRIDTCEMLKVCDRKKCIYANTAIDCWEEDEEDWMEDEMEEYSLAYLREHIGEKCPGHRTTAILNHGMNPGLVSHYVKHALKTLHRGDPEASYGTMARDLGLTTVHISERDTQKTHMQVSENRFINTWSVKGLYDEAVDPVQVSWGSHEKWNTGWINEDVLKKYGQVFFPIRGMQMKLKSYEPIGGELIGTCIPHAESASLSKLINHDGYRISVYYVYNLPDVAKASVHHMESLNDNYQYYVLKAKDIERGGYDSVGCLMFFKDKRYWVGAVQKIERALELSGEINGTCLQVAVSILASVKWALQNPSRGIVDPEDVDTDFVLKYCDHWMGDFIMKDVTEETRHLSDQFHELLVCPKLSGFDQ